MNAELLHIESQHVKDEFERLREVNRVLARAVGLAAAAYVEAASPSEGTMPKPELDERTEEWGEYFISLASRDAGGGSACS